MVVIFDHLQWSCQSIRNGNRRRYRLNVTERNEMAGAVIEPTFTFGSIGIMMTIAGSVLAGIITIVKATAGIHGAFSEVKTKVDVIQVMLTAQDRRLDHVDNELKSQTAILTEQAVQASRLDQIEKRIDNWDSRTQRLVEELGKGRVGAILNQKAQPGEF